MPEFPAMLTHAGRLRLRPVRLGVRAFEGAGPEPEARAAIAHFAADSLDPGEHRVGPLQVELDRAHHGSAASFELEVRNQGKLPVFVESIVLGFRLTGLSDGAVRFLRNGWQSWSLTTTKELDSSGEPDFPSGPWLRGMHHVVNEHPHDRAGWHESAAVSVVGQGSGDGACLAGVLETGATFGAVYLRRDGRDVEIEVEQRLEVPLSPGESRRIERVWVSVGDDPNRLLEAFGELWGAAAGARTRSPFRLGWCSWYHFFHDVTEADLLRNLEALAKARDEIPVEVVQLDDGYQRAIGDWTETNEKFPRGLEPIAREIRAAGFTAGIWTAPLCVVRESRIHDEHPEWLLRDGDRFFRGLGHDQWSEDFWVYALDTTREPVLAHLEATFRALTEMGFSYHKIDFLHAGAMRAEAYDPRRTRAQRLRDGLQAIRRGIGEDSFLLGCGSPLGPAVGIVDGMRIGPDVAPHWAAPKDGIPGLESVVPATRTAIQSIVHRAWMHRRLWLNDPDCLMARRSETQLTPEESRCLADAIAATGGMVLVSDDVPLLDEESRTLIRECAERARRIDGADERGVTRVADLLATDEPGVLFTSRGVDAEVCLLNLGDEPRDVLVDRTVDRTVDAVALGVSPGDVAGLAGPLAPHQSRVQRLSGVRELAVFCDFDGTFLVQDVGSTLAKTHIPERRELLWGRYESGELTAWDYTQELLDGFELPETTLDAFLETVQLDPGSKPLLAWCAERKVPFEILSDGFDRNLRMLQRIHDIEFDYRANRLRYEDGAWRIGPGHPDPSCGCGTGTCKGSIISAYRAEHPNALCVHIGNGRVSDLCGGRAADLTFARDSEKDTLAPALREQGEPFVAFNTLHRVIECLDAVYRGVAMPVAGEARDPS
jgi:2-hydroxy-3-keto-5-methylthiopentenyl-1-phosphate phosphatase